MAWSAIGRPPLQLFCTLTEGCGSLGFESNAWVIWQLWRLQRSCCQLESCHCGQIVEGTDQARSRDSFVLQGGSSMIQGEVWCDQCVYVRASIYQYVQVCSVYKVYLILGICNFVFTLTLGYYSAWEVYRCRNQTSLLSKTLHVARGRTAASVLCPNY